MDNQPAPTPAPTCAKPVYPEPWHLAMRGLRTYEEQNVTIEPLLRLSLHCACRAFYGSYWRAAFALAGSAVEHSRIQLIVTVRTAWYRLLRLDEAEIEKRWRA